MPLPWSTTCVATKKKLPQSAPGSEAPTKQDENRPQEPGLAVIPPREMYCAVDVPIIHQYTPAGPATRHQERP